MAEGYTRAKAGNIGVCIGTSGPAGTDMITGLYSASADSIPILCITGQAPRARIYKEDFQAVDIESIAKPELLQTDPDLGIQVAYDKAARTITVSDNGVGMSRDEVIQHLGTIAKSGTREFFAQLTGDQQRDAQLIGQFGVGFYSSFIVADRVTVVSRRAGLAEDQAVRWESDGGGEFNAGGADPYNFPPPFRGAGYRREMAGRGAFSEIRAYAGGKALGYFSFPFSPSQVPTTNYPAPAAAARWL